MGIVMRCVLAAVTAIFLTGCATDPLTRTLKKYGYVPAVPVPETQSIGDIYEKPNLKEPYLFMREHLSREKLGKTMEEYKDSTSLAESSGETKFELNTKVDILNKVSADLSANKVKKFKIKFTGVHQYLISKTDFYSKIFPMLKRFLKDMAAKDDTIAYDINDKFAIIGLLQVDGLEYEFYNENGIKVDVKPGSELEKVLQSKLGVTWSANQKDNLSFSSPRFIGYRMAQLIKGPQGYHVMGVRNLALDTSDKSSELAKPEIQLKDIPVAELRRDAE